jgi:hypothetical protein
VSPTLRETMGSEFWEILGERLKGVPIFGQKRDIFFVENDNKMVVF